MTAELTTEKIVTELLASREILSNKTPKNSYTSAASNLGDYLKNLHDENNKIHSKKNQLEKYTFIKAGNWKF